MRAEKKAPVNASAERFIEAPPELVWKVLTEIDTWERWNPDVSSARLKGPLSPGNEFRWKAGGLPIVSTLRRVEAPKHISWAGRAPGLRAIHSWTLERRDEGTVVRTDESFSGLLARLFPRPAERMLNSSLASGLDALRMEAERQVRRLNPTNRGSSTQKKRLEPSTS